MRISDWSSDVCSSDLPRQDHLTHSIAGTEELGAGIHHRHAEQPDEGTADAEADAIPVGAFRSGGALGQSCARLRHGLCLAITAEDVLHHLRSEEHTSELQSLMRISYAVFCLTKKNHTKQT